MVSAEEKRKFLKERGWFRCDRAIGPNVSKEYWLYSAKIGYQPIPQGLESAYKKALKSFNTETNHGV